MQTIAVLSDTHVPERADGIPDWAIERIEAADHVVHAGDFTTPAVLETVRTAADEALTAVSGNMDSQLGLPDVATLSIEDVRFVVTHGTGALDGYEQRVVTTVRETADRDAIGIAGHTHEPLDERVDGVRLLNPGSVTGAGPAIQKTMMTVNVDEDEVDVTLLDGEGSA
jgi:putative phosphoesterase